jgi:hypothetical protein
MESQQKKPLLYYLVKSSKYARRRCSRGCTLLSRQLSRGWHLGLLLQPRIQCCRRNQALRAILLFGSQALVTIVGIIIVTHKYIATAAMVRWNPTTLDTLVPYLIGLGEISAALMIGHQSSWWFAISFWLLTAIFVQGHTCSERRQIILITRQITISTSAGRLNSDDLRHRHAHHEPGCRTTGLLSKWVALAKYRIARRRHSGRDCNLSDRHGGSWKGRR